MCSTKCQSKTIERKVLVFCNAERGVEEDQEICHLWGNGLDLLWSRVDVVNESDAVVRKVLERNADS